MVLIVIKNVASKENKLNDAFYS